MDQYQKKIAVRVHQDVQRRKVIDHEIKMGHQFLDRSHYKRAELMWRLSAIRKNLSWNDHHYRYRRQLKWEWMLCYVQLRMCHISPLPWEANRYCRWV